MQLNAMNSLDIRTLNVQQSAHTGAQVARSALPFAAGRRLTATALIGLALASGACAEIEMADQESAARLADRRTELEEINVLVAYQKKRKEEAVAAGEHPDKYDDATLLREEDRFKRIWKKQREIEFTKFFGRCQKLSKGVVDKCNIGANNESVEAWQIDKCLEERPEAYFDPMRVALVSVLIVLFAIAALVAYRQTRRNIDPVAKAAPRLQMTATQGARSTVLEGTYKGHRLRIESAAPEADGGDKYVRVQVVDGIPASLVVRFGPLAPPTGLELPDLDAPEISDARVPEGYKLRLSDGASAEELLGGDVGFQLREFDPIDVRIHDGHMTVTTWFIMAEPDQVVELVDLVVVSAETYKRA